MSVILDPQYSTSKQETTIGIQKETKPPIKLSDIWKFASKELEQIKVGFGDAKRRQACAMGAISYYLSNRETCLLSELKYSWQKGLFRHLVKSFEARSGSSIWELNDVRGWAFEDFAGRAEELGL